MKSIFFALFAAVFVVATVNSQFMQPFNIPPRPNPWSSNVFGGNNNLGGKLNYDTPRYGMSGQISKDFGSPGARVGVEGRWNKPIGPNTKIFASGSASQHIGPGPKAPEYQVGAGIVHNFG